MDVEAPVWCSTRDLKKLIILGPSHLRLCVHLSVLNESTSHSARNLHHPAIVASFLDVNRPHLLQLLERQCAHRLLLATVSIVRGFNACSCRSPQGRGLLKPPCLLGGILPYRLLLLRSLKRCCLALFTKPLFVGVGDWANPASAPGGTRGLSRPLCACTAAPAVLGGAQGEISSHALPVHGSWETPLE